MADKSTASYKDIHVEQKRGLSIQSGASYIKLFDRRLLALGTNYSKLLFIAFLGLLVSFSFVAQGLLIATILKNVFSNAPYTSYIYLIIMAFGIICVRWALIWANDLITAKIAVNIAESLRLMLYNKLLSIGPGWILSKKSGVLQSTLVDGAEGIENYFCRFLPQTLISTLTGLLIFGILTYIDHVVGIVMGIVILLGLLQPSIIWRGLGKKMRFWNVIMPSLFSEYLDNLQGLTTLKSFNASRKHGKILSDKNDLFLQTEISLVNEEIVWSMPVGIIMAIGGSIAIIIGTIRMGMDAISVGELFIILLLVGEALRPAWELWRTLHFSLAGMSAAENVLDILEAEPMVLQPRNPLILDEITPSISFESVTFKYPSRDRPSIENLSFYIKPLEKVSFVGRSGAGKTTITSLLLRFFDPEEGSIKIGGHDIRQMSLDQLRAQFSIVSQDTYLFHGTVRDNLLLAKPGSSQEELETVSKAAEAHEFICSLPHGYDTIIGERGIRLSGGERQRIAIARALLKNAPILIFDEATSSVDIANEHLIQNALKQAFKGHTIIVIAHRLSTICDADKIFVLEKGRLVKMGVHDELLRSSGIYAGLVRAES
jgi:ATP-binding cassette subfamily B protein/ATP-binding cassette subfamily C protein